jgi:hypothetical protein
VRWRGRTAARILTSTRPSNSASRTISREQILEHVGAVLALAIRQRVGNRHCEDDRPERSSNQLGDRNGEVFRSDRNHGNRAGGDSGAPVVNDRDELVAMVYAGSAASTMIIPIEPILQAFNVTLMQ